MSRAGRKLIKAAREAVRFSELLASFDMKDQPGAVTVVVNKRGKVIGTVHGQRFRGVRP